VDFADLHGNDVRRLVPHMSLGLIRGVFGLAANEGITTLAAAMVPALVRLLERFGIVFQPLGPPIDFHGLRQPCIADCEALLAGMAARNEEYHRLADAAYRRKSAA
jgi:N-acyl amino acid synthase of PEP-CTERM/exosortase system